MSLGINSWNLNSDDGSTFTGGTIDSLTVTGSSVFNTLYATQLSGGTIYSGATDLWDIITDYMTPESTGYTYDSIGLAVSDETTALTSGATKLSIRMPYNFQLTGITAYVRTSGSTSTIVDINSGSTSLLLSAITIPANQFYTVASNIVSTYSALTEHDVINIDVDSAGTSAAGLKLWLEGYKLQTVLGAGGTGGGPSTFVQNGTNTFTGGTTQYPSVNITAATLNNLTVTGNTSLNVLSATTIYSGGTNLETIIQSIASATPFSGSGTGNTGQYQKIYSSGSTWTAPTGVYSVVVEMWGGGGGGGAGFRTGSNTLKGGGGGASGAYITGEVEVVPGTTYQITIGSGGTPGYYIDDSPNISITGSSGGDTIFNTLRSPGGLAGNNSTDVLTGVGGVAPYLSGYPSSDNVYQTEYFFARGYNGANQDGVPSTSNSSGGNGGDVPIFGRSIFGPGSGGETPNNSISQVGGSATLFGGGGAGGTGYYLDDFGSPMGYSGGSGTSGLLILKWNAGSGTTYSNVFSGGTISGNTNVTGSFSAQTYYSGSTPLDVIFSRYAASSHTHTISDISNLQGSLNSKLSASATNISDIINLSGSLGTKIDLSATTIAAPIISATTLSAGTIFSGSTNLQSLFNTVNQRLAEGISTGIISGGTLSINASNNTKFDISAGLGYIVNYKVYPQTTQLVSWATQTGITVTNLATLPSTDIAINASGTAIQQSSFTKEELRSVILLGGLDHSNLTNIRDTFQIKVPTYGVGSSLKDLSLALGDINIDGNIFSSNGVNLKINKSAGSTFSYGRNFATNLNDPNSVAQSASTQQSFRYAFNNGFGVATFQTETTDVSPNSYDNGSGVIQAVPNNKFTIQRILMFSNTQKIFIQYGTTVYNSLSEAISNLAAVSFVNLIGLKTAIVRGYLITKQGSTTLSTSDTLFVNGDKFGGVGGGSGVAQENFYTTGATLSGTQLIFDRNDVASAYTVNIGTITGNLNVNGNFSANTFVSGSTSFDTILNRYAYSSHTHNISDVNNLLGSLNTKANLSGATFTGNMSAPIITATTYFSGSTNLGSLFAPKTMTVPYEFAVACSDETTQITTGTSKVTFLSPCSFTLTGSVASLSSSGSTLTTVNVKKANVTIYSTKVTIDANEFDSTTAATAPVITGGTWNQYDKITVDIDGAGTSAKGLKVLFTGTRTITT